MTTTTRQRRKATTERRRKNENQSESENENENENNEDAQKDVMKEKNEMNRSFVLLFTLIILCAVLLASNFSKIFVQPSIKDILQSLMKQDRKVHNVSAMTDEISAGMNDNVSISKNSESERKIHNFLSWFTEMGGTIFPSVTLGSFPEYGGYGLMATSLSKNQINETINIADRVGNGLLPMEEMFSVPPSIIITAEKVISKHRPIIENFEQQLYQAVYRIFHASSMMDQDVIIALALMVECALGEASVFKPYLDVLPKHIPRLDTLTEDELMMLQDSHLAALAKESANRLRMSWEKSGLQELASSMVFRATREAGIDINDPGFLSTCLSFNSFHKYVATVSSRAMVLDGKKLLTPLADMTNYAPRNDGRPRGLSQSFKLYHQLRDDGSMTIRSDRSVRPGEQIFEDYGDTDNSLYLEAHGFVPDENPFHCTNIPSDHLPQFLSLPEEIKEVLLKLRIVSPSGVAPNICVMADGTLNDKRAEAFFAVVSMNRDQAKKCLDASATNDMEYRTMQCFKYSGYRENVTDRIRLAARKTFQKAATSLEEDLSIQATMKENDTTTEGELVALKFRITEKELLSRVIQFLEKRDEAFECSSDGSNGVEGGFCHGTTTNQKDSDVDTFNSEMLNEFNAYVQSIGIAENYIEAKFIGKGMRLGAIATKDLNVDDIYLSIPSTSTMCVDTAHVKNNENMASLLNKYRSSNHDGGFLTLMFYLIHERFIAQTQSKWWPYLNVLPTLEELKESTPLFFDENKLDNLAGSDSRTEILSYQHNVAVQVSNLSTDYDVISALGDSFNRDNFYWAQAILDSRSIWWDGKRHLVPLLDMVNCGIATEGPEKQVRVHETVLDESGEFAITRASHRFLKSEQVIENYGQPNYIYFLYHGFKLENNTHDCALVNNLRVDSGDEGAKDINTMRERLIQNGFFSFSPKFCIKDSASLDKVANFFRIKHDMEGNENGGMNEDVKYKVREFLELRLLRYSDLMEDQDMNGLSYAEKTMLSIVKDERRHFMNAIDMLLTEWFQNETKASSSS